MNLFVSAGEPSGDVHGANLIREIKARASHASVSGFGGPKMAAAGATLHYPLTDLAVMWVGRVLLNIRTFSRLLNEAETYFRSQRPDAVIVIDYPGFHWHLAKRAKKHGIPVYYFQPPQLWAWAGWRVKKVRDRIETVFTAMPFEDDWYRARGVKTEYVGHPYYDEIAAQRLDGAFMTAGRAEPGPVLALLPGSRDQEVKNNFATQLATAKRVLAARPDARVLVAAFNESQAAVTRSMATSAGVPVAVHVGRTPEIIELATACVAVSGSVGLELMCRAKPTVVVYKLGEVSRFVGRCFMTVPYISLINLLAKKELFPEYLTSRDRSPEAAAHVLGWLNDESKRLAAVAELESLRATYAKTGACGRAASRVVNDLTSRTAVRRAA
jgi:lipid-A-disaccharide synthase